MWTRRANWADRWPDPWRAYWAERLRAALQPAAEAFAQLLGLDPITVGVVPAVYFTRLRMGSVPYLSWADGSTDIKLAFPWEPRANVPPFTCFAPSIERRHEPRSALIARVGSIVDSLLIGERRQVPRSSLPELPGARGSALSWSDDERTVTVVDEWIFQQLHILRTTAAFVVPAAEPRRRGRWIPYVPLLYFHSSAPYDTDEGEAILRAAMGTPWPDDFRVAKYLASSEPLIRTIRAAVIATLHASHVRAREWLNQKTQLLSRAGYEGLKQDLQRRIGFGEQYAAVFFDIDNFKKVNDALGYDGADLVAAAVTDRALGFMQRSVSKSFADYADARQRDRAYVGAGPDGFRALLAHVSGDEFRFLIRHGAPDAAPSFREADIVSFTSDLVRAVESQEPVTTNAREDAATAQRSAVQANRTGDDRDVRALRRRVTVSAGVTAPRWSSDLSPHEVFTILNHADLKAEDAARDAKDQGRNRVVQRQFRRPRN